MKRYCPCAAVNIGSSAITAAGFSYLRILDRGWVPSFWKARYWLGFWLMCMKASSEHMENGGDVFSMASDASKNSFQNYIGFHGGLFIAFPWTATVECDLSETNLERKKCREILTDLSEAGIQNFEQFKTARKTSKKVTQAIGAIFASLRISGKCFVVELTQRLLLDRFMVKSTVSFSQ